MNPFDVAHSIRQFIDKKASQVFGRTAKNISFDTSKLQGSKIITVNATINVPVKKIRVTNTLIVDDPASDNAKKGDKG